MWETNVPKVSFRELKILPVAEILWVFYSEKTNSIQSFSDHSYCIPFSDFCKSNMTILLSEPERKRDMPFTFLKVIFEHTPVLTVYFRNNVTLATT